MNLAARRVVGNSGLEVGVLGFGGAGIGNLYRVLREQDALDAVRESYAAGVRYFDTAPFYGFGLSELRVGTTLRGAQPMPVISTKVGRSLVPTGPQDENVGREGYFSARPFAPKFDYSYDAIRRSHEESLERLGVSRVDILLVHDIGTLTHGAKNEVHLRQLADGGGYRALRELRDSGAVRAIGLGVNECEIAAQLIAALDFDCVLLAGRYTLLEQPALETLLPLCEKRGVSILCGGPFNSGVLATGSRAGAKTHYNYAPPPADVLARVSRLEAVCDEFGVPLQAAALQFPLGHPRVATVVAGAASGAESRNIAAQFAHEIPAAFWRALRDRGLVDARAPLPDA
ncbi:MAG TPA: aldo/keto reductase [Steroidobacteraceae bacterium]|nr:aldo/keto reductase [Steroidobacteraceae bacterium]